MKFVDSILRKCGYIRADEVKKKLDYGFSVAKRLDEFRENVYDIYRKTDLFVREDWHFEHMATQDDFLMRLYHMVHGHWPDDSRYIAGRGFVRPRPEFLRECNLPEYSQD